MELEFRSPTIQDRKIFHKLKNSFDNISSESAFGTLYLWSDAYNISVCESNGLFFKKINERIPLYEFPRGISSEEDLKKGIELLNLNSLKSSKANLHLTGLIHSEVQLLKKVFPGKFLYTEDRDNYDYIYKISDLANLKGKKYHGKRNHILKFKKTYDWKYVTLSSENKEEGLKFFEKWFSLKTKNKIVSNLKEYVAIKKAIENYEDLQLVGGLIYSSNEIIACTIGEKINSKVLLVHFEKAFSSFEGAYSVINNEFCQSFESEFEFVNREEDMGIPGLRKSKLSYKPSMLLEKYRAVLEG